MLDILEFEGLVQEMLYITDEQIEEEDDNYLYDKFHEIFDVDFDTGFKLAQAFEIYLTRD